MFNICIVIHGLSIFNRPEFHPDITDATDNYVCVNSTCSKITSYKILQNNSLGCQDDNLQVLFKLGDKLVRSFIPPLGIDNSFVPFQNRSKCLRVRKYFINNGQILVSMFQKLELLNTLEVNAYIEDQFYLNGYYFQYFSLKLGWYDIERDSFFIYAMFKVKYSNL